MLLNEACLLEWVMPLGKNITHTRQGILYMARRAIAQVVDNQLWRLDPEGGELPPITVGASDWYEWLNTRDACSFAYRAAHCAMTARREERHGGWYWYGYRLHGARMRKVYLGKAQELTPRRLDEAARKLAGPRSHAGNPPGKEEISAAQSAPPLLRTRLAVPPTPEHLVARPRLLQALQPGGTLRLLTLLCAPAGWGKTTLLSEWVIEKKLPAAWISLHMEENDPANFWAYLLEALRLRHPGIQEPPLSQSPRQTRLQDVLAELINRLAALKRDVTIVLDNYHVISNQAIHDAIKFLLDHLPPHVHLVIATRGTLPISLARLYMNGQVAELRADTLRFTSQETRSLLAALAPEITSDEIAALEECAEGWPAGLRLALLTLQENRHAADDITSFAARNHYLQRYLIEEVLDCQPTEIQAFLLHSAFLDRFNAALGGAVSGLANAQEILEQLEREQLFLFPLDEQRDWFRYHNLFTKALCRYLECTQPALLPVLHRRASQWFEEQGVLDEAINHSLAAQDVERAAALIEKIAYSLIAREEVAALQRWLDALPLNVIRASPQICVISAWLIFLTTQAHSFVFWLDTAEEALHACEHNISPAAAAALYGEIVALRAANKLYLSDVSRAVSTCNQVLASLPPDNHYARSLVLLMLGLAYQRGVNVAAASQALAEASSSSRAIGHGLLLPYVMIAQAELYELQGHPFEAMRLYYQVLKLTNGRVGHPTGIAYAALGYLFWEWQDVETARQYLRLAWDVGMQANNNNVISETALCMAQVELAQGNTGEADYWLQQWERFLQEAGTYKVLSIVWALRARLSLEQGRLDDALLWMQRHMPGCEEAISPRHEIEYFVQVRVLIAAGRVYTRGSYLRQAMTLLEHLREHAETIGRTKTLIRVLTYEALVLSFQEDTEGALAALERALALAEPGRYIRVFVDKGDAMAKLLRLLRDRYKACKPQERPINLAYVRRILTAFTQPVPAIQAPAASEEGPLVEPLSWREREVLRLMATGRKNEEIAKELVVVTGTVKAHINSIYRKLSVNSRVQALTRARALHLL